MEVKPNAVKTRSEVLVEKQSTELPSKTPCEYHIVAEDDGVTAYYAGREVYKGDMKGFNALLRA